jgi:hypothetical protein
VPDIDEPEITQTDTPADNSSGELESLLAEYEQATARPTAANGHDENAEDSPHNGEHVNGDAIDKTLEDAISDAEIADRAQRSRAYYVSLQLDQKINTIKQHEYERDLNATVASVRGDLDVKDGVVRAWLDAQVREDGVLKQSWLGRADDPQMWKAAERVLIKTFHQEFSRQPDPNITADLAMVAAAIRGASAPAQTETAPNYSRLSNADMRDEMRKLGIQPNF